MKAGRNCADHLLWDWDLPRDQGLMHKDLWFVTSGWKREK